MKYRAASNDPFECPACGGTEPSERLGNKAWCGCDPKSPFPMVRRSINRLVDSILEPSRQSLMG